MVGGVEIGLFVLFLAAGIGSLAVGIMQKRKFAVILGALLLAIPLTVVAFVFVVSVAGWH